MQCQQCTRLREHCAAIAATGRHAYRDWEYWGRPVPAFGDPRAQLLILGLAPGAHGSNRTGRMFTGDRSGDVLYSALHQTGFASQPRAPRATTAQAPAAPTSRAAARCAPPGNKPTREELATAAGFFERELDLLPDLKVVVALGALPSIPTWTY